MRITWLSQCDQAQLDIAQISLQNKFEYTARYGYPFVFENRSLDLTRPAVWGCLLMVLKYLPTADWVFWSDVDSFVMRPEIPLQKFLENTENKDFIFSAVVPEDGIFLNRRWPIQITTSHFFVRNTEFAKEVITEAYKRSEYIDSDWKREYGGKHAEEEGALNSVFEERKLWNRVKLLKRGELHIGDVGYDPSIFMVHFGGPDKNQRMKRFLKEQAANKLL